MDTYMIVEMIGYLGSLLVLVSFLMQSVVRLRVINTLGGLIFAVYALLIQSYPTALMNFCLVGINIYHLVRLKKNSRHFDLIDGKAEDSLLTYLLNYYMDDIKTYFPDWDKSAMKADTAYIVCCDAVPAGILLGKMQDKETMEIILDYSTPTYRDCSVGKYLYSCLPTRGIQKLVFTQETGKHETYLQKMGFFKENVGYVKKLR